MTIPPPKNRNITFFAAISLISFLTFPAEARDIALSIAQIKPPSTESPQLHVVVSVLDSKEQPIKGLTAANFVVELDGKAVDGLTVRPVSETGEGIAVLLVLDVSGSMKGQPVKTARMAAARFIDQMGPNDVCGLAVFGSAMTIVAEFTSDRGKLKAALGGIEAVDKRTRLYQAVFEGSAKAAVAPLRRAAVVILTDGKDTGSPITLDDAINGAATRNVPIYPLAYGSNILTKPLERIAALSGGRFLRTPELEDLQRLYVLVQEQLRNQYLIVVPIPSLTAGQRSLTVRLRDRGNVIESSREFAIAPLSSARASSDPTQNPVSRPSEGQKGWQQQLRSWSMLLVLAAALLSGGVFLFLRRRNPDRQAALVCGRCGEPLPKGEGPLCGKCSAGPENDPGRESSAPPPAVAPGPLVWLDIVAGPGDLPIRGQRIPLLPGGFTIGRGPANSLDLRDPEISKNHALIIQDPKGHFAIEDRGSHNGTFVNGNRVERGSLQNGDRIRLGSTEMVFADHRGATGAT
jgi:VWFA-related protein